MTKQIKIANLAIGGGASVTIQSMTNTDTRNVTSTLEQIERLYKAGCEIVRVSVYDEECAEAVKALVDKSPVPLVADIHFNHRLAIRSIENGIHKVRINPGNIGGEGNVRELADCLKMHNIPVRIGVNSGSVEKDILAKYGGPTPEALVESALSHARMLERCGYYNIVLSMKASGVRATVDTNRIAAARCDYPLHIGVTEAGTPGMGNIKSAIGIGALLLDGIGDTIRVSLTGDPVNEVYAALDILRACGIRRDGVNIISCPTCGRTCIPVGEIADRVKAATAHIKTPLTVAVMGCIVNGPGEAKDADIGVACGQGCGILFAHGETIRKVGEDEIVDALMEEIAKL